MAGQKVIKRYANRKLYDTERSCYVTLDDISEMIRSGDEVRVVDNKSGEDLTSVTLAQIIFETEKKSSFMPMSLLRDLIQHGGGAIGEFARERVDRVQAKAYDIKETAQKLRSEIGDRLDRVISRKGVEGTAESGGRPKILADLLASSQRAFDDLQRGVEERFKSKVGGLTRYAKLGRDMDEIRRRLAELEQRLEKYQG